MNATSDDRRLLIEVFDLFSDGVPRTLQSVVDELAVSEEEALTALEELERKNVLVRARGGTQTPVWKPRNEAQLSLHQQR